MIICVHWKFTFDICRGHSNFANCVRFSPDGSKFITVSSDKKGIIYDGKTGEKLGELSPEDGHKGSIYAVSWSPDSKQASVCTVELWAWLIFLDWHLTLTSLCNGYSLFVFFFFWN